jgi:RNA polymerase sigma-70 factor (ECF subfamily)
VTAEDTGIDFDEFFAATYAAVVREAALVVGDTEVAREVAQDAYVQALVRWRRVSGYEFPLAWVRRVAFRRALRVLRHERKHGHGLDVPSAVHDTEPQIDLRAAITRLPPRQRAVVVLHYLDDLPVAAVAEMIGCSQATAKVHLHRARQSLAAMLQEDFDEPTR